MQLICAKAQKFNYFTSLLREMIKAVDGEHEERGVHQTEEEMNEYRQKHKKISFSSFSLFRG